VRPRTSRSPGPADKANQVAPYRDPRPPSLAHQAWLYRTHGNFAPVTGCTARFVGKTQFRTSLRIGGETLTNHCSGSRSTDPGKNALPTGWRGPPRLWKKAQRRHAAFATTNAPGTSSPARESLCPLKTRCLAVSVWPSAGQGLNCSLFLVFANGLGWLPAGG